MSYQLVCSYNSPNHYITEINKNTNKNVNLLRMDLLKKKKQKKETDSKQTMDCNKWINCIKDT